jgi:hypothetical protein
MYACALQSSRGLRLSYALFLRVGSLRNCVMSVNNRAEGARRGRRRTPRSRSIGLVDTLIELAQITPTRWVTGVGGQTLKCNPCGNLVRMPVHVRPTRNIRSNRRHRRRVVGHTSGWERGPTGASFPPAQPSAAAGMGSHAVHEERGGQIVIGGYGILIRRRIGPETR